MHCGALLSFIFSILVGKILKKIWNLTEPVDVNQSTVLQEEDLRIPSYKLWPKTLRRLKQKQ